MNINIIAVGKLKERYLVDGCQEYMKRLNSFCKISLTEIAEFRLPDRPSPSDISLGLQKEGDAILSKISADAFVIALCIEGRMLSSMELSHTIDHLGIQGKSNLVFVIGGSWGLDERVKARANLAMSFSPMTFPHQLARIMLLEQIYRSFSIIHHLPYHK